MPGLQQIERTGRKSVLAKHLAALKVAISSSLSNSVLRCLHRRTYDGADTERSGRNLQASVRTASRVSSWRCNDTNAPSRAVALSAWWNPDSANPLDRQRGQMEGAARCHRLSRAGRPRRRHCNTRHNRRDRLRSPCPSGRASTSLRLMEGIPGSPSSTRHGAGCRPMTSPCNQPHGYDAHKPSREILNTLDDATHSYMPQRRPYVPPG